MTHDAQAISSATGTEIQPAVSAAGGIAKGVRPLDQSVTVSFCVARQRRRDRREPGPPPGESGRESIQLGSPASVSFDELIHPMNRAGNSASGRLSRKRLQENAIRIPSQRRTGRLVLKLLGRKLITNNSAFTGYRRYQVLSNSLWCLRLMSGADVGDDALEGAPAPCAHGWATSARPVSRINRTLTLLP